MSCHKEMEQDRKAKAPVPLEARGPAAVKSGKVAVEDAARDEAKVKVAVKDRAAARISKIILEKGT